ncbi:hypothetical protein MARPO_0027s0037 [Marchantia polymorpha]|uniref:Uncharacterized protein n=1 Tax=Marchantia polymorpha TaxID=3197 RepID=A0A2R6X9X1_MARPO|nr:hypothetical protein MARPO_0027s0037 [Marchantia polymorpha]|eukprot:PTQ42905.1 hypothetical protein MARPO_0027s0037 [Marchantia polymorpha]
MIASCEGLDEHDYQRCHVYNTVFYELYYNHFWMAICTCTVPLCCSSTRLPIFSAFINSLLDRLLHS